MKLLAPPFGDGGVVFRADSPRQMDKSEVTPAQTLPCISTTTSAALPSRQTLLDLFKGPSLRFLSLFPVVVSCSVFLLKSSLQIFKGVAVKKIFLNAD